LPSASGEEGRYKLHDLAQDFADSRLDTDNRDSAHLKHSNYYLNILSIIDELYVKGGANYNAGLKLFDIEWLNIKNGHGWAEKRMMSKSIKTKNILQMVSDYPAEGAFAMQLLMNPHERIRWLETAIIAAHQLGNKKSESTHLNNIGIAYCQLSEPVKAINFFQQSLSLSEENLNVFGKYKSLGNIGAAYAIMGLYTNAIECFKEHLLFSKLNGCQLDEATDLGNIGCAYADLKMPQEAIEYCIKAANIF
jgi:tetratricopeptide (TPR) repeat protein